MEKKNSSKHKYGKAECEAWKEKFEILDEKYARMKSIFKTVFNDFKEASEKHQMMKRQYDQLKKELEEKEELLKRLQSVSEAVVDEYSSLKTKYELESELATKAIKRATKYVQENQARKRKSAMMLQKNVVDSVDTNKSIVTEEDNIQDESYVTEIEMLNKLTSDLQNTVACLMTELKKETDKQASLLDDVKIAKKLFEEEMISHNNTKQKLLILEQSVSHLNDVAQTYASEEIENVPLRFPDKSDKDEELNQKFEVSSNAAELQTMSEQLQSMEQVLIETEQHAYSSDRQVETLQHKVQELECQIQRLNAGITPVIPPPPPPPPPSFNPIKSFMTLIQSGKKMSHSIAKKEKPENHQQKAMTETIDAIKKGSVQLRPTPKSSTMSVKKKTKTSAVGEMMEILNTLKKCKDTSVERESQPYPDAPQSSELLEKLNRRRHLSASPESVTTSLQYIDSKEESEEDELFTAFQEKRTEGGFYLYDSSISSSFTSHSASDICDYNSSHPLELIPGNFDHIEEKFTDNEECIETVGKPEEDSLFGDRNGLLSSGNELDLELTEVSMNIDSLTDGDDLNNLISSLDKSSSLDIADIITPEVVIPIQSLDIIEDTAISFDQKKTPENQSVIVVNNTENEYNSFSDETNSEKTLSEEKEECAMNEYIEESATSAEESATSAEESTGNEIVLPKKDLVQPSTEL